MSSENKMLMKFLSQIFRQISFIKTSLTHYKELMEYWFEHISLANSYKLLITSHCTHPGNIMKGNHWAVTACNYSLPMTRSYKFLPHKVCEYMYEFGSSHQEQKSETEITTKLFSRTIVSINTIL